ncbi:hypothetical protein L7F22_004925 [Adiantum nelumboides]|nr:hypothetical protein [Adiantum nelumboides]
MPGPKSSVPKFGIWNKNEDLAYSIVFDKVRAEKESSLHSWDGDCDNQASVASASPRSNGETGDRTSQSLFKGKREKFLHTAKENRRFAPSHQVAFRNYEAAKRGAFYKNNKTKESGYSGPRFTSWQAAVLQEHQNLGSQHDSNHQQAHLQNPLGAPTYKPSTQLKQSREIMERKGSDQDGEEYQGRPNTRLMSSGRHRYREEQANAKARSSFESFDMQGKPTVPKFGDWEHGEIFTTIFNNVRKERSSKNTSVGVAALQMEDDLYKGSQRSKRRRSWASILCCFKSLS